MLYFSQTANSLFSELFTKCVQSPNKVGINLRKLSHATPIKVARIISDSDKSIRTKSDSPFKQPKQRPGRLVLFTMVTENTWRINLRNAKNIKQSCFINLRN